MVFDGVEGNDFCFHVVNTSDGTPSFGAPVVPADNNLLFHALIPHRALHAEYSYLFNSSLAQWIALVFYPLLFLAGSDRPSHCVSHQDHRAIVICPSLIVWSSVIDGAFCSNSTVLGYLSSWRSPVCPWPSRYCHKLNAHHSRSMKNTSPDLPSQYSNDIGVIGFLHCLGKHADFMFLGLASSQETLALVRYRSKKSTLRDRGWMEAYFP